MNGRARPFAAMAVALALAGGATLAWAGPSGADPGFEGNYNLTASASGLVALFGSPSSQPYPVAAGELPLSSVSLGTGPTSFARASVMWPGPLVADAGSLGELLLGQVCGPGDLPVDRQCVEPGKQLPAPVPWGLANYPVRAEASFPTGHDNDTVGPMKTTAAGDTADAAVAVADFASSSAVTAARITTHSRAVTTDDQVSSLGESVVTGLNLGNSAITIDSVKTVATASSDGTNAKPAHTITVSGLTVMGRSATVDETGVHANDSGVNPAPNAVDSLNEQLAKTPFKMKLFLTRPVDENTKGAGANSSSGSLIFVWSLDGANQIVVSIGGADASAQATPPLNFDLGDLGGGADLGGATLGTGSDLGDFDTTGTSVLGTTVLGTSASGLPALPSSGSNARPTVNNATPVAVSPASFSRHVPAGPIWLAILFVLAGTLGLQRAQAAAAAAAARGRSCPNDRRS